MVTQEILQAIAEGKWTQDGNGTWGHRPEQGNWWRVDAHDGWALITMNVGAMRLDVEVFDATKLPQVARALERAVESLWPEIKDV